MIDMERKVALNETCYLLDTLKDAKEYGSILKVKDLNWGKLHEFIDNLSFNGQMSLETFGLVESQTQLRQMVEFMEVLAGKYDVVATNPPYMGSSGMDFRLLEYIKINFPDSKTDLFAVFIERCNQYVKREGYLSMITQNAWMFLSSYENLRKNIIK